jgi:carbon-monoxide dehydrogenase iron sulfur subunit
MKLIEVDPGLCTGCNYCSIRCNLHFERNGGLSGSRIKVVRLEGMGASVPIICEHCEDAPCMEVCPTKALYRDHKTGAVLVNEDYCIGCKMCLIACPFGIIRLNPKSHKIIKCDLCGGDPICVKSCPTQALKFVEVARFGADKAFKEADKIVSQIK